MRARSGRLVCAADVRTGARPLRPAPPTLYGHPADTGFLDIIGQWKAEQWDPDALVKRYKAAGARYFIGMACHHDNLDLFDSPHPWNSTRVGPKRDIIAGWQRAARAEGLRFGVSNHSSHAWH